MTAPTSNRDELRQAVARAILEAQLWPGAYAKAPEAERNYVVYQADAAIAAYERHRPRAAVVLTRKEWARAVVDGHARWLQSNPDSEARSVVDAVIRVAFPWLRVEGE